MERAAAVGVKTMLAVGTDPDDSARAVAAAGKLQGVYAAVGIHPQLAHIYRPEDVNRLEGIVTDRVWQWGRRVRSYRAAGSASEQEKIFIAHMGLARRLNLPIVIHDREAHDLTVAILDRAGGLGVGRRVSLLLGRCGSRMDGGDRGFLVSIPGVITYRRAQTLRTWCEQSPWRRSSWRPTPLTLRRSRRGADGTSPRSWCVPWRRSQG
jgi:TatD DNase family protein